jgi:ATP-dependent Clp protease ATP-binding subunit ClpA
MFERYTEKARRVIFFARYEASQFGTPEIQSEHLLLGILREGKTALNAILGLTHVEDIRLQIEGVTELREKIATSVDLPLTTECKRILAYAAEEAERLAQKHIGIEHLLLGILREEKSLGAKILHKQGIKLDQARKLIADAKDQLAAGSPISIQAQLTQALAGDVPLTRKPVTLRIVVICESAVILTYRSYFGPPCIGESIRMTADDGSTQLYRVQDVTWETALNEPAVLREVRVVVTLEENP